jgi:putative ABC transport system substrate-binding protein
MKTKVLLVILISIFLSAAQLARAQQPTKIPRMGVMVSVSRSTAAQRVETLKNGLRELGYVEGKNIIIEYRYAEGKPDTLPALVNELIALKVDLIVTDTTNAAQAAKNATTTIPVIFTTANDPVGDGQVASLARPGGNLTGFSILALDLNGKRLELLKEAFPKVTRVLFLTRADTVIGEQRLKEAEKAAKALKLRLRALSMKDADDLEGAFERAKRAGVQGVIGHPSTFLGTNRDRIIKLAVKHRLPAIYPGTQYTEAGGLMSYGPDTLDNWRRAATYIDKILKGDKAAELPVQQPMRFEFVINLIAAKQIGVTIPPNVLVRADKVIR